MWRVEYRAKGRWRTYSRHRNREIAEDTAARVRKFYNRGWGVIRLTPVRVTGYGKDHPKV